MTVGGTANDTGLRVVVDRDLCCGAGNCVANAPDVFDQDTDGLVRLHCAAVPPGSYDAVLDAVDLCPTGAISLADQPRADIDGRRSTQRDTVRPT
jgi:ferredoxin